MQDSTRCLSFEVAKQRLDEMGPISDDEKVFLFVMLGSSTNPSQNKTLYTPNWRSCVKQSESGPLTNVSPIILYIVSADRPDSGTAQNSWASKTICQKHSSTKPKHTCGPSGSFGTCLTSRYGLWPQQWHFAKTLPRLTASPCTSPWPALTPVTHLISPDSLKGIHALSWPSILYTQHRHRSGAKGGGSQILLVRLSPDQKVILYSGLALFSLGKTSQWLVFQKSSDLNKMLRLWYELVWFGLEPVTQAW